MAKCAQCGVTNPEGRQTCYGCGSWLTATVFTPLQLAVTESLEPEEVGEQLDASFIEGADPETSGGPSVQA